MDQQSRSHNRTSPNMSVLKFFMWNRALATVWCTFFRPHLPKVLRPRQFFAILKCKPSSRYSPSCALFVDNFCRSRPQPAETDTLLRRPQKPLNPKKNTWFRAQECFHPWFHAFPKCYASQLHDDWWLTWWCGLHDETWTWWQHCPWTFVRNSEVFELNFLWLFIDEILFTVYVPIFSELLIFPIIALLFTH